MKMADNIESDIDPNIQAPNQQNINPRLGSENSPLKIVSCNICDSTDKVLGDKTNESDFVLVIDGSDVICLQETKKEISIPNYKCYNGNRNRSRSGGVFLGVHRSLEKFLTPLPTGDHDIIAVKLNSRC